MASPLRSPATRARQSAHDDEISRAMDKAVKTRTETYEQFASRLPTVDRRERGISHELRGALSAIERVNADLASLNGPALPDPRKTDEEFEAELVQFRAFAKSFGEFAREFDADGVPTDRSNRELRARRQRRRREREDGGRLQGGGHEGRRGLRRGGVTARRPRTPIPSSIKRRS